MPLRGAKRKNKFNAKPCEIDGIKFASQREGRRYVVLRQLERTGQISGLKLQVKYVLRAVDENESLWGIPVTKYIADFVYFERNKTGGKDLVVEDSKGFRTDLYKLKRKMMRANYGIEIREV